MAGYIVKTGYYEFAGYGLVHVLVRRGIRRVSARWKGGRVHVSAPMNMDYDELRRILGDFAPALEERRPEAPYQAGQHFDFGEFCVDIAVQRHVPDKMLVSFDGSRGVIEVGSRWDIASPDTIRTISGALCRMAQRVAPGVLIPRAEALAAEVGRRPLRWTISNGHRTLGHCSEKGEIALSYALMFYPGHLRDYVIWHELAHLSEMNHSARFHEVCDGYCGGRAAALEAELRCYPLPVIK